MCSSFLKIGVLSRKTVSIRILSPKIAHDDAKQYLLFLKGTQIQWMCVVTTGPTSTTAFTACRSVTGLNQTVKRTASFPTSFPIWLWLLRGMSQSPKTEWVAATPQRGDFLTVGKKEMGCLKKMHETQINLAQQSKPTVPWVPGRSWAPGIRGYPMRTTFHTARHLF